MPVEGGFTHATDLIEHIKSNFNFGIAAACYPEAHVESTNSQTDSISKTKGLLKWNLLFARLQTRTRWSVLSQRHR